MTHPRYCPKCQISGPDETCPDDGTETVPLRAFLFTDGQEYLDVLALDPDAATHAARKHIAGYGAKNCDPVEEVAGFIADLRLIADTLEAELVEHKAWLEKMTPIEFPVPPDYSGEEIAKLVRFDNKERIPPFDQGPIVWTSTYEPLDGCGASYLQSTSAGSHPGYEAAFKHLGGRPERLLPHFYDPDVSEDIQNLGAKARELSYRSAPK